MNGKLLIGAVALSSFASLASASVFHKPYVGVEVMQTWQGFKSGFGKNVFAKSVQDYGAFVGTKFSEHFGLEAGYDFQPKKGQDNVLVAGDKLLGLDPLTGVQFDGIHASYKATHPYLGLFAEYHSDLHLGTGNVVFQAMVGASSSRVKARVVRVVNDGGVITPSLVNNFVKTKVVPMVKLSASANLCEKLALRLSLNYRNMSAFKVTSDLAPTTTRRLLMKMRDSFGVGLGLKYTF